MKRAYILFFAGLASLLVSRVVPMADFPKGFFMGVAIGLMLLAAFFFGREIARKKDER